MKKRSPCCVNSRDPIGWFHLCHLFHVALSRKQLLRFQKFKLASLSCSKKLLKKNQIFQQQRVFVGNVYECSFMPRISYLNAISTQFSFISPDFPRSCQGFKFLQFSSPRSHFQDGISCFEIRVLGTFFHVAFVNFIVLYSRREMSVFLSDLLYKSY